MDAENKRRLEQNNAELAAYVNAMQHTDSVNLDAMGAHVDELLRERCRIMGLPEDEIARIEQESETAVDEQIAAEIQHFAKRLKRTKVAMTKMQYAEDEEDIHNVEAWAEIIEDVLYLVPFDNRMQVLQLAAAKAEHRPLRALSIDEFDSNTPGHWNAIMRLKSLIIQVFARDIGNNHSPQD